MLSSNRKFRVFCAREGAVRGGCTAPNWKQQMSAVLCTADHRQRQQKQQQQTNTMYK